MNSLFDTEDAVALFAEVLLPIPLKGYFTYRIPLNLELDAEIGKRVVVQFGSKKVYTGIIINIHNTPPKEYSAKAVLDILDFAPIVTPTQVKLFKILAEYYMCTEGEMLNNALPTAMKISSESNLFIINNIELYNLELSESELEIISILKNCEYIGYSDLTKALPQNKIHKNIKSLFQKNIIGIEEEIKQKFKPKTITKLKLHQKYNDKSLLNELLKTIQNKEAQSQIVLTYLSSNQTFEGILKSELTKISTSAVNTLIKNGVLIQFEEEQYRIKTSHPDEIQGLPTLSNKQQESYDSIRNHFQDKETVLLHGITGSGKTEIYINLIDKYLQNEFQVLYLLPEIALTTQIVERLKKCFGDKLGVYHSKFSENERVEVWTGLLEGRFQLIIGARSALFLPFQNLGLIIVDEEHETSYKQHDPAPRYHARDSALVLAKIHQSKTLLGSATPSIESYWQATQRKFGLVSLLERYGVATLPEIRFAKITRESQTNTTPLSSELLEALKERISKKEQSILFLNRRGFAPLITCESCGWTPSCPNCNVSLTYHQYKNKLSCHYCGYFQNAQTNCFACGSTKLKTVGYGTEKIEDELKLLLPDVRVKRMDLETTRSKYAFQELIAEFSSGNIDILVGTQMVTKGLDFDNVTLVGVIDVDQMLYFPDFRAHERTFQLVTQVSGRAGRKHKKGEVIIQTYNASNPFLNYLHSQNYIEFYNTEITERQHFNYPPFVRLIKLTIKNKNKESSISTAKLIYDELYESLGSSRVKGPATPSVDKIREQYIQEIIIKLERDGINLQHIKKIILAKITTILELKKSSSVTIDVDFI